MSEHVISGDAEDGADTTIAGIVRDRWGIQVSPSLRRFRESGWKYDREVVTRCPHCRGALYSLLRPYVSRGKQLHFVAIVCPGCPQVFDLAALGVRRIRQLLDPPEERHQPRQREHDHGGAQSSTEQPQRAADGTTRADDPSTTLPELVFRHWGVRPAMRSHWFDTPGWWYENMAAHDCETCGGELHAFRKVYDGPLKPGKTRRGHLVAVVCPYCPATFQLRDIDLFSFAQLMGIPDSGKKRSGSATGSPRSGVACDVPSGQTSVSVRAVSTGRAAEMLARLMGTPDARVIASNDDDVLTAKRSPRQLLHWVKINDPDAETPRQLPATDVRVLLPREPEFDTLARRLDADAVPYRRVRYWVENETISNMLGGRPGPLRVTTGLTAAPKTAQSQPEPGEMLQQLQDAFAASDAFKLLWETHDAIDDIDASSVAAETVVSTEWLSYLPHPTLNPAQAQAAPPILGTDKPVVVTAPTGSGKTVIGMLAVLKTMLHEGKKATWLVPQRSLTEELDNELARWRKLGIRIERLSGDHVIDRQRIRNADMWLATTEKFESLSRSSSLQNALAQVGCLVVDEIHLLGDPQRGPVLEALLTRLSEADSPARLVGLSATVSNADEIASWLRAELVAVTWRPSRLTWQLPAIPDSDDRAEQAARTQQVVELTARIAEDAGSVLVFCGSKHKVRTTALALATARGANTRGVAADDLERLERVCTSVGIGIHYKDWEHKRAAERGFRDRELDVLVATTTVAAGVNLPARAVIVRDTQLGTRTMDVATVQQMFGRAGRIGAGETEGWAYLITTSSERASWQGQLTDGYTVRSEIIHSLADHLLAEVAQDRIRTIADSRHWWQQTLAYRQGSHDLAPVHAAVELLLEHEYLTSTDETSDDDTTALSVTELGSLTTRLMVSVRTGIDVVTAIGNEQTPETPDDAEKVLLRAMATQVPQLADAPINDGFRSQVLRLLRVVGNPEQLDSLPASYPGNSAWCEPGDLAYCTFLLFANNPHAFAQAHRAVVGLPASALQPILTEAPRYFSWLAEQGFLGTVHPWIAVAAADFGRRIQWRIVTPNRGSGRLLWICEEMADREHADTLVPQLYRAAREAGYTAPDWSNTKPPRGCQLNRDSYQALLQARTTGVRIASVDGVLSAHLPSAAAISVWTDVQYDAYDCSAGHVHITYSVDSAADPPARCQGAAIFTARGDYHADGWLAAYNGIYSESPRLEPDRPPNESVAQVPDVISLMDSSPAASFQPRYDEPVVHRSDGDMVQKIWLDVPFSEKDEAKALGARWDQEAKRWYAPRSGITGLEKWVALQEVPNLLPGEDRSFGKGLFVDLVPSSCWFTNVRSCVAARDWERLRRMITRRAGDHCEICGSGEDRDARRWLEAHERWFYDDRTRTQSLRRLICLCTDCHTTTHFGFAQVRGIDAQALAYLRKVTGMSARQADEHVHEAFELWNRRSQFTWALDLSMLTDAGITITPPPSASERPLIAENSLRQY